MKYFTHDDCQQILESYKGKTIGSVLMTDDSHPYIKEVLSEDIDRVYDCINIWCSLYEDICGFDALSPYIRTVGFIESIRNASKVSAAYKVRINEYGVDSIDGTIFSIGTPWVHLLGLHPARILQILDYPKRILIAGSNLDNFCRANFIKHNKEMKEPVRLWRDCLTYSINRHKHSYDIVNHVGQEADPITWRTLFDMRKYLTKLWGTCEPDLDYFKLPAGSTYEGKKEYVDKFVQISRNYNWISEVTGWDEKLFLTGEHDVPILFINKLITVPKNWKSKRIVCPEETARQVVGYTIAHSMRKRLRKLLRNIPKKAIRVLPTELVQGSLKLPVISHETTTGIIDLTDQTRNQVMAQYASIHDYLLATVDFSAASDSISVQLVKLVVPEKLFTQLDAVRAKRCKIGDKVPNMVLNTFMTMGHSCTFDLETGIFWSMGVSAVEYCWIFLSSDQRAKFGNKVSIAISFVCVYGDDVIIPDFAYDYFVLIAKKCGFDVNKEKSFGGRSGYRESCGEEYYCGVRITVAHYPRGTSNSELAELIGQQHSLCNYPRTNAFLIDRILEMRPSITMSYVGSPYSDIWVPEISDTLVPINIYDNGKEYVKVSFQKEDIYIPIRECKYVAGSLHFQYSGNNFWYEVHYHSTILPNTDKTIGCFIFTRVKEQEVINFSKDNPSWSVLWSIKEIRDYLVTKHKCEKGKPPICYWSWEEICKYSQQFNNSQPGKMTSIAKLVEQSEPLQMGMVVPIRLHDSSIRNPKDVEPYTVHTIVRQEVPQEKNATRINRANQLAYLLKLSEMARRPKDLEDVGSAEDLLVQDYRDDNLVLDGTQRIASLCNCSTPVYQKKKIAPERDHDYSSNRF